MTLNTTRNTSSSMEDVSAQCCFYSIRYTIIPYSIYLKLKSCDLDPGWFKVIQGQRSRWKLIVHAWFPTQLRLTPSLYLSPFSKIS